jgi:hypothetical protein
MKNNKKSQPKPTELQPSLTKVPKTYVGERQSLQLLENGISHVEDGN